VPHRLCYLHHPHAQILGLVNTGQQSRKRERNKEQHNATRSEVFSCSRNHNANGHAIWTFLTTNHDVCVVVYALYVEESRLCVYNSSCE
jgi:hypothetical protein